MTIRLLVKFKSGDETEVEVDRFNCVRAIQLFLSNKKNRNPFIEYKGSRNFNWLKVSDRDDIVSVEVLKIVNEIEF